MTKDEKTQAILQVKAECCDEIADLLRVCESNRNFHAKVAQALAMLDLVVQGIARSADASQTFPCALCGQPSTCQVYKADDDGSVAMCEECANTALTVGGYNLIESE